MRSGEPHEPIAALLALLCQSFGSCCFSSSLVWDVWVGFVRGRSWPSVTATLRRYHKQLCRRAVCPHGTICGRPHCPRAKMFYDRAAFITAGSNITAHEAFPGNALPWPPYLGRGAWRTRVAGTQNGHAFAIQRPRGRHLSNLDFPMEKFETKKKTLCDVLLS